MPSRLDQVLIVFDKMAELEKTIADLYAAAAQNYPQHAAFWFDMAKDERRHALRMKQIQKILAKSPHEFERGRPLHAARVEFMISNIENSIQRLKDGGFQYRQFLFAALDLEQSILESGYMEIVEAGDLEYQTLMSHVVRETDIHKGQLLDKIEALK